MILETARLRLRPWEEADAEECFRYARDPRVGPAAGWPAHTCVGDSRRIIREVLSVPETYAVVWKETGLPIGSIGLHFHSDLAEGDDECELGYWLGVPYWGRGIMTEAAAAMLRRAFEDLGLRQVWCGFYDGNRRSARVQEKLGFRRQWTTEDAPVPQMGETRRGYVNLLTREEWLLRQGADARPSDPVFSACARRGKESSMQFMIKAYDGEGTLERRMAVRPRHLEGMQKMRGHIICAGGLLDDEGRMKGSMLVMEFRDRAELDGYLAGEPYVVEHVWDRIEIEPVNVVIVNGEKVSK